MANTYYMQATPTAARLLSDAVADQEVKKGLLEAAEKVAASSNPQAYHYTTVGPQLRIRVSKRGA